MKVISLRNIPPEVARMIETRSEKTGLSLNKTVIHILEEALGLSERSNGSTEHGDLDDLAGVWSEQEAREFDRVLAQQRQIDPELWE